MTRATGKVSREQMEQVLLAQGPQGEQVMTTIAQEYIELGLKQGLEQGRLETKERIRRIARQLLELHDVVTVSEITGFSLKEVQELAESASSENDR